MQSFSLMALPFLAQAPAAPDPSPTADQILNELSSGKGLGAAIGVIALLLLGGVLIQFIAYWISSKVVAPDESGFGNAVKLWFLFFLAGIGITILSFVLMILGGAMQAGWLVWLGIAVGALLFLIVAFKAPMHVYKIGFFRALAFLVIAVLVNAAANLAVTKFVLPATSSGPASSLAKIWKLSEEERKVFLEKLNDRLKHGGQDPSPEEIARDKTKPLEARQQALQKWQAELEAQRAKVPPGDQAAADEYNAVLNRYVEVLKEVQAESAAPRSTPAGDPPAGRQ